MATTYSRYPARVYDGDQLVTTRGAVIVADGKLRIGALSGKQVDVVLERSGLTSIEPHISRAVLLHFDDGTTVRVLKGDGCSCGSPLKKWWTQQRGTPAREGS